MPDYTKYSEIDFLHDPDFIRWLLIPAEDGGEQHWSTLYNSDPSIARKMDKAADIFRSSVKLSSEKVPAESVEKLHDELLARISKTKSRKKLWIRTLSAVSGTAAVFMLSYLLLYNNTGKKNGPQIMVEQYSAYSLIGDDEPTEVILRMGNVSRVVSNDSSVDLAFAEITSVIPNEHTVDPAGFPIQEESFVELIVPYGKQSSFMLEDGTKVWLNAGSKIYFPVSFGAENRVIHAEGEIYLDVAREENRPFIVKTATTEVCVLGTSFGITCYPDEATTSVVLVNGSVEVNLNNGQKVRLSPGEMLKAVEGDYNVSTVDVMDHICWRDGWIRTQSTALNELTVKLSRYYNINIVCEEGITERKCTGKLVLTSDFNDVLSIISQNMDVDYRLYDDRIELCEKMQEN